MRTAQIIDDLSVGLSNLLPPGLGALRSDLERNFRALLQSRLARLNLVTREEFEVQQEVLQRTRDKLKQLEAQLAELENQHK